MRRIGTEMVANARKFNAALARFDVEMRRIDAQLELIRLNNSGNAELGVTEHRLVLKSEDERRIDAVKFVTGDNYVCRHGVWKSVGEILRHQPHRWPDEFAGQTLGLRKLLANRYRIRRR